MRGVGFATLVLLAACSVGSGEGGGTVAVINGQVAVSADNLEFDASVIQAPVGRPFAIEFTNLESVPHNLSVYTAEGGDPIVIGTILTEAGESERIEVPALAEGSYFFVCDVHPDMTGSIIVGMP